MTTVQEESSSPQFAHAVRGYDRIQVDEYIQRLNEWATAAQARAVEAERQAAGRAEEIRRLREQIAQLESDRPAVPESAVREAADRAAEAVARALREADLIRRQAAADAERRLDEAGERAVAVVEAARRAMADFSDQASRERQEARGRAGAIVEQANRDADGIRAGAEAEGERLLVEAREAARQVREGSAEESRRAAEAIERLKAERAQIIDDLGRLRSAIHSLIGGSETKLLTGGQDIDVAPDESLEAGANATVEMRTVDAASAEGGWPLPGA